MSSDPLEPLKAQLRKIAPGIPDQDLPRFAAAISAPGSFAPGPDSQPRDGVPKGTLTQSRFERSAGAYPGVSRDVRLYVPASASGKPLALMVFQDGARYLGPEANAVAVLDNLIASGEIPPMAGLFVEPGQQGPGLPIYGGVGNRSVEYDAVGPAYANFLIDELIPEVTQGLSIANDPGMRAICGLSSGGICAFNAAWERPDYFSKVVSHCGSYVDIRGGHSLAPAVRRASPKALRVFLQTGEHDLNIIFGAWTLANRELADALEYRGYDHQLVVGEGGHSLAHGGSILPQTLRWLWRS
jgi:enterochelin esterase-like enzyme